MHRCWLLLLALLLAPIHAWGQASSVATASVVVSDILKITIDDATITFPVITTTGYTAADNQVNYTIESNTSYNIFLLPTTTHFSSQSGANNSLIPSQRIEFNRPAWGSGVWMQLDIAANNFATCDQNCTGASPLNFRYFANAADPQDTYTIQMTFSVTAS